MIITRLVNWRYLTDSWGYIAIELLSVFMLSVGLILIHDAEAIRDRLPKWWCPPSWNIRSFGWFLLLSGVISMVIGALSLISIDR